MISLDPHLATYRAMLQEHHTQLDQQLQQLHQEIDQQLETLRQQEDALMTAEAEPHGQIRPSIETDARCLLSTPELATHVKDLLTKRFCSKPNSSYSIYFDPDPTKWLLGTLDHPVQILDYLLDRDDYVRKDEVFYTNWLYWLTVQIGDWQQKFYIATASLIPGNPATYHPISPITQYYDFRRKLKLDKKVLKLAQSDLELLHQELSCLLVAVGVLFNIHARTEHFCYPRQQWEK